MNTNETPIGVSGGFRVNLGKESKARKQFAAKYGRESLNLAVFGRGRRVSQGEINARILSSISLEGPCHPYEMRKRMKEKVKRSSGIPDQRTFGRHVKELSELTYLKVLKEEPHHAGKKRIYTLTEKGKAVAMFLPEIQQNLLTFINYHDSEYRTATPAGRAIRLLLEKNIETVAKYFVRTSNTELLIFNFEDEDDEDQVRALRLAAFAMAFINLERRIRRKEKPPRSITKDDALRFNNALKNDPEFRRTAIELTQGMKEGLDYFRSNVESVLNNLKKLENQK
jgi:DNA-binding PadR family transcriptional regulator